MKIQRALLALVVLIAAAGSAAADAKWSQVSWYVAYSVAHSITYGIYNSTLACSQTALYYVEPSPINGVQTKINTSTDQTGAYFCQNDTQGALTVHNDGSVGLNISAEFNQITTGVRPKIAMTDAGWESACSATCNVSACDLTTKCVMLNTTAQLVRYNLEQNSSQQYWLWADFNGVAGTSVPTKGNLTTSAVRYNS